MSLGVKLTIGSWVALIIGVVIYFVGIGMAVVDPTGMMFLLISSIASLFGLICTGLGVAACVFLCKEKGFDTVQMVVSIVLTILCCGPFVPLVLLFIPSQEG